MAEKVAAGELDAALTTEPVRPYPAGLVWTPLYQDRFWLFAPPGQARRSARDLLAELPFIRFDSKAWAGRVIDRELRRMRVEVHEEMVLDSQDVILRMVEKGLGVAVLAVSDEIFAGLPLTCLPFGEPQLIRNIVMLERQDRRGGGRQGSGIGNGPEAMSRVSMVGNDLKLDSGVGTCGKDGQSVPVGVGQPTLRLDNMTVGGTQA
eukprot:gene44925-55916_t